VRQTGKGVGFSACTCALPKNHLTKKEVQHPEIEFFIHRKNRFFTWNTCTEAEKFLTLLSEILHTQVANVHTNVANLRTQVEYAHTQVEKQRFLKRKTNI
jgi:hypothetical protein